MTPRQERFVAEYLVDLNATQAALRAGYSKQSARSAHRLLQLSKVAAAIRTAQAKRARRLEISAERVLAEYAKIAFANMADFATFGPDGLRLKHVSDLAPDQTAAVAEVTESKTQYGGTVRFKLHDKLAALNAIARHIGLNAPDKLALTDTAGGDATGGVDAYEIARQIAFALRQGEAAQAASAEATPDAGALL